MSSSLNNVFYLAGESYKRYRKVVPSRVAGTRLDPVSPLTQLRPITFILASNPDDPSDISGEILEVYSELEDKYVLQANRSLFSKGLLAVYDEAIPPVEESENFLTDLEIVSIASVKTVKDMRERLSEITSYYTVTRILVQAKKLGARKPIVDLISARQAELAP